MHYSSLSLFAPTATLSTTSWMGSTGGTGVSGSCAKPVPSKERMRLRTWLSVLGQLLSAEGATARMLYSNFCSHKTS
jgi:hypothetical protein